MKKLIELVLASAGLPLVWSSSAVCSQVPCAWVRNLEMRTNLVVSVTHDKKPLGGVTIDVYRSDQNGESALLLSGKSKADGTFVVADLRPGGYWLGVTLLGVQAAGPDCFQVTKRPPKKAKRALTYSWGDNPLVVSQLAGKLTERQPGTGGTPAWNHEHLVSLPIPRARLTLRNATSGASYTTTSTEDGGFAFDSVPSGIYVLQVEYENEPNTDPRRDHVVVEISPKAGGTSISFTRMQSTEGGTNLGWSPPQN